MRIRIEGERRSVEKVTARETIVLSCSLPLLVIYRSRMFKEIVLNLWISDNSLVINRLKRKSCTENSSDPNNVDTRQSESLERFVSLCVTRTARGAKRNTTELKNCRTD